MAVSACLPTGISWGTLQNMETQAHLRGSYVLGSGRGLGIRIFQSSQEGHIWGSMRRTAFILGSGLLLLVAFWNSVTWHLQRFWGASGYFWQAQWERLLSTFEGKEWILYIIGATQVPSLLFWSFNGLLLVVDTTGKPNFISRYRIQVGKNEPEYKLSEGRNPFLAFFPARGTLHAT
uniref:Fatty acid hydroxylase domain containing 2 n=1 Tax=Equus caballus TaxID=9796 RepID=A0A9L0R2H3_HORSE